MARVGVIGAGAWGTALACAARRAGNEVLLQAHEAEVAENINRTHANPTFLPNTNLDPNITATQELCDVADCDVILMVAPAQYVRATCQSLKASYKKGTPLLVCAKGIELDSGQIMSEVIAQELPEAEIGILSGPTFAIEVANALPSACTLAMGDMQRAMEVANIIGSNRFRIYASDDVIGAQIGGAVKNVLAIASGMVSGKGFGDNARAALITRGIAELARLGVAKGAKTETLMGLSGMGDLTLTCNSMQSRNFSLGVALGQGEALEDILKVRKAVTEGVFTARSVCKLADSLQVDMPICAAVNKILNEGADITKVVDGLLARPFKEEI
ncbi:Glycerol-3-phosphate dehydrogenase (NAD(P)+) [Candidatus Terasakiella magnetica]|uniref:Glycerol-3-phosphate dehydrogenase [NAD(P)+] n=1 Tax=Candidatus Terasakiella magnetica TaxID=1867952 RepID=A0A1C3RG39_9PROT|nr:NAD(P)H-dependent glycerol-3-phosphate dehydrogenase [Candidatus Terasakiella magnetica]SCA56184.1 Glycerol-3-phosphate dehydrogenase (NAD(P)+) [Candidatus Terasakiella magnetica]